ncbi:phosphate ABC transporter permease [Microcoleus sp. FACHB-68]|uniref:phosphate ABC transporter permease n=1 Tax=Microcoleus sp. FACHB-68 TaxID=2692826 RepID=UPI0016844E24|nr:phosphate ABC transporter permease [Microcoleus sp. FACHB-68]MBD1935856.1 phosphate ABC transporter permease [Microcoleus sp. FACHB-68]
MLIPITRKTFEQLIPAVATGAQYAYYSGKFPAFLKRLLISVVAVVVIWLLGLALGNNGGGGLVFLLGITASLYWLWGPVALASFRNVECRRYQYAGFWQGRVLDVYFTDDLIGQEETVNTRGDLVIVENRERRLNLEVGDKTGFSTQMQVPLRKEHEKIVKGQVALMLVMSNQPDLSRISKYSDIYIPNKNIWVSDYPYLRRDEFIDISRQLREAKRKRQSGTRDRG